MAVEITGRYLGGKRIELVHQPSRAVIQTSAPLDNRGDGKCFSPTDLMAASLGSCVLTVMAIYAEDQGIDLSRSAFSVKKHMSAAPRRVSKIELAMYLPHNLTLEQRQLLEQVGLGCPVKRSFNAETEVVISFEYNQLDD